MTVRSNHAAAQAAPQRPSGIAGDLWAAKIALRECGRQVCATRQIRVQLALFLLFAAAGALRGWSGPDWAIFVICVGLGIHAEINNTAQEMLADLLAETSEDGTQVYDARIGKAKDVAAASVTPMFFVALTVAIILLIRP